MTEKLSPSQQGEALLAYWGTHKQIRYTHYPHAHIRKRGCLHLDAVYCNLEHFHAIQCDLSHFICAYSNLPYANFQSSILHHSVFSHANLEHSKLQSISAPHSQFLDTDLSKAKLQGANLQQCNLQLANLTYANLEKADLRGSNLCATTLLHANLHNSTILGATINQQTAIQSHWSPEYINELLEKGAIWTEHTIPDQQFAPGIEFTLSTTLPTSWREDLAKLATDLHIQHTQYYIGTDTHIFWAIPEIDTTMLHTLFRTLFSLRTEDPTISWLPSIDSMQLWERSALGVTLSHNHIL